MPDLLSSFLHESMASVIEAIVPLAQAGLFFFYLGLLVKGRQLITDIRRALPQTGLNLQIILFNLVLISPLIVFGIQAMDWLFVDQGLQLVPGEVWAALPAPVVVVLGVVIGDFIGYWRHRLEHTRWLWPSHAVHHSDTEMTWLTLERFHPINRISTFLIDTGLMLALGLPPAAIIANNLVRHYYGFLIHADLPWTYGPLGRGFVSPAMHRWHHAADRAAFDTNYATVFSVFDQAFGTYRVPGPCTSPLGVTDRMAPTLMGQLGHALKPQSYRRRGKG